MLTLHSYVNSIIAPFDAFEIQIFEKIIENGAFALAANAPFSIIFSKVFKTLCNFFLLFSKCYLKIENDVMI